LRLSVPLYQNGDAVLADALVARAEVLGLALPEREPLAPFWSGVATLSRAVFFDGDLWATLPAAQEAVAAGERAGDLSGLQTNVFIGYCYGLLGAQPGAVEVLRDAVRRALQSGVQYTAALGRTFLASVLAAQGDRREAGELLRLALEALGAVGSGEPLVRLAEVEALLAAGLRKEALARVRAAREVLAARAARIGDEALRQSFLAVPENARTLALALEADE